MTFHEETEMLPSHTIEVELKTRHRTFRTVEDYFDNFEDDLKRITVIPTGTFGAIRITSFVFGE